jgi:poly-gamma-glutamate capsule biosynthesis protein CapA/YwtB (metallophosphatase superfamily)
MERMTAEKIRFASVAACLLLLAFIVWRLGSRRPASPPQLRGTGDTLIIAATGDWLAREPMPSDETDRGYASVAQIVKGASLGLTTLEQDLLDEKNVPALKKSSIPRWPYGTTSEAKELRRIGFTLVSLANNHAADYGIEGMKQTWEILDHEGVLHAGSGENLQQAMAPVYVGAAPRRVAVIAVTTSATSESRATSTQGEILGRPGVSVLRYSPRVTVDPSTFATLRGSGIGTHSAKSDDPNQLILSGTVIRKGQKTTVEFVGTEQDSNGVLAQIRLARSKADVVIVMLHSHEPSNESDTPAEFVQQFARAAIDAGANIVVGDGPHQLRGIELYRGRLIFYSLGNFAFQSGAIDPSAVDVYDRGTDLFGLTLGAMGNMESHRLPNPEEPIWWESVIAITTFDHGTLKSIQLQPVDLGVDLPMAQRGAPRCATPQRRAEILQRLALLSQHFGTQLRIENGLGVIDIGQSQR